MSNGTPTDEEIKKRIKQVSRGMAAVAVLLIAMIVWSPVDEEFRKGAYRVFTLQPLGVDWKNVKVVQLKTHVVVNNKVQEKVYLAEVVKGNQIKGGPLPPGQYSVVLRGKNTPGAGKDPKLEILGNDNLVAVHVFSLYISPYPQDPRLIGLLALFGLVGGFLAFGNKFIANPKKAVEGEYWLVELFGRIFLGGIAALIVPLLKPAGTTEFYGVLALGLGAGFSGPAVLAALGRLPAVARGLFRAKNTEEPEKEKSKE